MQPLKILALLSVLVVVIIILWQSGSKQSMQHNYTASKQGDFSSNTSFESQRDSESPSPSEVQAMMQTPVEFYGVVLDEESKPVIGAEISCTWPLMTSMDAPIRIQSKTPDGKFHLKGVKALSMHLIVNPPAGYRRIADSEKQIQFAELPERLKRLYSQRGKSAPALHVANVQNPTIFRVHKIELTDSLYHGIQGGKLMKNGTFRYFSMVKYSSAGFSRVPDMHSICCSLVSDDQDFIIPKVNKTYPRQYSWGFKINVPGGGVLVMPSQERSVKTDQRFVAPPTGYIKELTVTYSKNMDEFEWRDSHERTYYVEFSDKTYARLEINAEYWGVRLTSFYNPTGSRQTLFNDSKVIPLEGAP